MVRSGAYQSLETRYWSTCPLSTIITVNGLRHASGPVLTTFQPLHWFLDSSLPFLAPCQVANVFSIFLLFLTFSAFLSKNIVKAYLDQHLVCAALKCWSIYPTNFTTYSVNTGPIGVRTLSSRLCNKKDSLTGFSKGPGGEKVVLYLRCPW